MEDRETASKDLTPGVMRHLEARAQARVERVIGEGRRGRYDALAPIVAEMRRRLGRAGVREAVDVFIEEGIFEEWERTAVEKGFRRVLRDRGRQTRERVAMVEVDEGVRRKWRERMGVN